MSGAEARVPALWPRVRVDVDNDGQLSVQTDGQPWPPASAATNSGNNQAPAFSRGDLPKVVVQVAEALGSPIRVEVHDSGRTYAEVVLPTTQMMPAVPHDATVDNDRSQVTRSSTPAGLGASTGSVLHWHGFEAGERVEIAVVVATTQADADGGVQLRVPPALRSRMTGLLAYGQHSTQAGYLAPAADADGQTVAARTDPAHAAETATPRLTPDGGGISSDPATDPMRTVYDNGFIDETSLADDERVDAP